MLSRVLAVLLLLVLAFSYISAQATSSLTLVDVHQYILNTAGDYKTAVKLAQTKLDLLLQEQKQQDKDAEALQAEINLIDGILAHVNDMKSQSESKNQIIALLQGLRKQLLDAISATSRYNLIEAAKTELQQKSAYAQYIENLIKAVGDAMTKLSNLQAQVSTCATSSSGNVVVGSSVSATATSAQATTVQTPETNIKYFLSNGVEVTNPVGVKVVGNTIVKTDTKSEFNAYFSSSSLVTDKQDNRGVYFEAVTGDKKLAVGLSRVFNKDPGGLDFAIILIENGDVLIHEKGVRQYVASRYVAGDNFAIEYRNGQVEFSHNGLTIYSARTAPSFPLLAATTMFTPGAAIKNLLFTKERPTVSSSVAQPDQPAMFKNIIGLACDWGKLTKSNPLSSEWNTNAFSVQSISADQFVNGIEFTPRQNDKTIIIGLSSVDATNEASSIDFGVYLFNTGYAGIIERNQYRGNFMAYNPGDKFSIVLDELGMITYRKNSVAFYTSTVKPTLPLYIDVSALTSGVAVDNIKFISVPAAQHIVELGDFITFTSLVGVASANGDLTKTSMNGDNWDAGAFSVNPIDPENTPAKGFSFSVGQTTGSIAIGLSNTNAGNSYANVDFSFLFGITGFVQIYERGNYRAVNIPYTTQDSFALVIRFGKVHYIKNGKTFYTSTVVPTFPLYVDVNINSRSAAVKNIRYIEDYESAPKAAPAPGDKVYFNSGFIRGAMSGPGVLEKVSLPELEASALTLPMIDKASKIQGVQFKCTSLTSPASVSLVNSQSLQSFTIACNTQYTLLQTVENGADRGYFGGRFSDVDTLAIRINEYGKVEYLKNGAVFYESQLLPTLPLAIQVVLGGERSGVADVVYLGAPEPRSQQMTAGSPIVFKDFIGMSTAGNNGLQQVGIFRSSYYSGAVSIIPITETSFFRGVEAEISGKLDTFLALSENAYVDPLYKYPFALYTPTSSALLHTYELGIGNRLNVLYQTGDKIGIIVQDGKVKYTKNGEVIATSSQAPKFPLYVIVSGMYPGSGFNQIKFIN